MDLVASRSVVEHELRRALASRGANPKNMVLLLRAAPAWHGEPEVGFEDKGRQASATVAEFDDFDPRLHYKLTLSPGELTATERNAAAFRPETADDVDLDL